MKIKRTITYLAFVITGLFASTNTFAQSEMDSLLRNELLKSLHHSKLLIDEYILSVKDSLPKLQLGEVNEDSLTLRFPYLTPQVKVDNTKKKRKKRLAEKRLPNMTRQPFFPGIEIRFHENTTPDRVNKIMNRHWHFLNSGMSWTVVLPGGRFKLKHQSEIVTRMNKGMENISRFEQGHLKKYLSDLPTSSKVLTGEDNLEIALDLSSDTFNYHIDAKVNFRKRGVHSLETNPKYLLIIDDSAYYFPPFRFGFIRAFSIQRGYPFVDLNKNQDHIISQIQIPFNRLDSGKHSVRILMLFNKDGWLDRRAHAWDGPAVYRDVESAWVGRVFSNKIYIFTDPEKGFRGVD
jgi:hypothetical protein